MASTIRTVYSSLVKEATMKAGQAASTPATKTPITAYINHVFGESEDQAEKRIGGDAAKETHLRNLELFLRSKRIHSELVARYNPAQDMTDQERARLSARRVGLNMPIEHKEKDE